MPNFKLTSARLQLGEDAQSLFYLSFEAQCLVTLNVFTLPPDEWLKHLQFQIFRLLVHRPLRSLVLLPPQSVLVTRHQAAPLDRSSRLGYVNILSFTSSIFYSLANSIN